MSISPAACSPLFPPPVGFKVYDAYGNVELAQPMGLLLPPEAGDGIDARVTEQVKQFRKEWAL